MAVGLWPHLQVHHVLAAEHCLNQSQISALSIFNVVTIVFIVCVAVLCRTISLSLCCAPHGQLQRCVRPPVQLICLRVPALQAAAVQQGPGSSASRPTSARVKRKFEDVEQGEVPTAGPTAVQQAPVIAQGLSRNAAAVSTAGSEGQAPASVQGLSLPPGDGVHASLSCTCCYHSAIPGHLGPGCLHVQETAESNCSKEQWIPRRNHPDHFVGLTIISALEVVLLHTQHLWCCLSGLKI